MESQTDATGAGGDVDDVTVLKEMRLQLVDAIDARRAVQQDLLASIETLVPDIASSLDISLRLITAFTGQSFSPIPKPNSNPNRSVTSNSNPVAKTPSDSRRRPLPDSKALPRTRRKTSPIPLRPSRERFQDEHDEGIGGGIAGDRLSVVRTMVAVCLLELVPFAEIDSAALLRRLESDHSSATSAEKAAMVELGGEFGAISAVETALRRIAEDSGGVQLEDFTVNGMSMLMVWGIDRSKLLKELPESSQQQQTQQQDFCSGDGSSQIQAAVMPAAERGASMMPRPPHDLWMGHADPHLSGMPPMYPGAGAPGSIIGQRGGPRMMGLMGIPRVMGVPPLHRSLIGPTSTMGGPNPPPAKPRTEEDDRKDIEAMLKKKTFRELQKSKTGEELLDLIHRPTAKETAVAAKVWRCYFSFIFFYCN